MLQTLCGKNQEDEEELMDAAILAPIGIALAAGLVYLVIRIFNI
jgi:hypothetical protein